MFSMLLINISYNIAMKEYLKSIVEDSNPKIYYTS